MNIRAMEIIRYFDAATILLFALIWIGLLFYLRLKKRKARSIWRPSPYFTHYIFKVLDYTLFQFQSLLILKTFHTRSDAEWPHKREGRKLIPLITLTSHDLKTSFLNILLFIPFGFLLPFITSYRARKTVIIGAAVSITIELLQLLSGFAAKTTFRIADVNDVIFNTLGVLIGYVLFIGFLRICRFAFRFSNQKPANALVRYIIERPQTDI